VEVLEDNSHVLFVVTDDGDGISPSIERQFMKEPVTTKGDGLALSMFLAVGTMEKIGAKLSYEGKARMPDTNKPGARFKISFLKDMPK
jgi:C4-dicarboxylate-specific signal transduction histidine kinase